MGLTYGCVTGVVEDALVAAEVVGFGKAPRPTAARDIRECLLIAEAAEEAVLGGNGVIETAIAPAS